MDDIELRIALFGEALENAPFEFWARDANGVCIVQNAAARARFGNLVGTDRAQLPPEVLEAWRANNARVYAGECVQNEAEYVLDGVRRYYRVFVVPLRVQGKVAAVLGVNIDLTDHRRAEQALAESERRLREALRIGRMGYLDWNLVTDEIHWSPETYAMYGYPGDGTFTPTLAGTIGMVPAEDLAFVKPRLDAMIAGTAPYDIDHRVVRPDGKVIHVHAQGEVMRDEHGKALRMLGTVVDVTERRLAEEKLREVDRRRSEFLGLLSHELRNPLAVIRSSLYVHERATPGSDQAQRALAAIEHQVGHLGRLVDDLLDITRISSGKIHLQRARLDLVELAHHTVDDHRALLGAREVTLDLAPAPVWVRGDATRIAQVLGNLLSNAAKFTLDRGRIAVRVIAADGRARLDVADDGVGIDPETIGELFAPFVQADHGDRNAGGLGLGLSLVKMLVELHGGEVAARSEGVGRGACFTIHLPLDDQDAVMRDSAPARRAATGPSRKVLVIEDNVDVAQWLAEALSFAGHEVAIALDGAAGLATARTLAPDAILCDIGLPGGIDGYAVARALRDDPALERCYRVALSGFALPEDQKRAREAGFDAHLAKPPDFAVLERMLAELPRR